LLVPAAVDPAPGPFLPLSHSPFLFHLCSNSSPLLVFLLIFRYVGLEFTAGVSLPPRWLFVYSFVTALLFCPPPFRFFLRSEHHSLRLSCFQGRVDFSSSLQIGVASRVSCHLSLPDLCPFFFPFTWLFHFFFLFDLAVLLFS